MCCEGMPRDRFLGFQFVEAENRFLLEDLGHVRGDALTSEHNHVQIKLLSLLDYCRVV